MSVFDRDSEAAVFLSFSHHLQFYHNRIKKEVTKSNLFKNVRLQLPIKKVSQNASGFATLKYKNPLKSGSGACRTWDLNPHAKRYNPVLMRVSAIPILRHLRHFTKGEKEAFNFDKSKKRGGLKLIRFPFFFCTYSNLSLQRHDSKIKLTNHNS